MDRFPTPSLKTRLSCFVYEALLLFGPVFAAGWVFSTVLQQRHALYLRAGMQAWLFFVIGLYFVWFWSGGRQTLPMKTWGIKLVTTDGASVSPGRALVRYMLAWLWFLPGVMLAYALEAHGWFLILLPLANFVLWALASQLDRSGQFLHDRMAGTLLVRSSVRGSA